ncbi:HAD family hydrolase [Bifidobacterium gallicum]|uniref:Heat shock protein, Hsp20 family n=1 Tax=Bifidobacterium gallicum DSM 20093 = LMG 11596 TaxID=561180 RepID=D1NX20_9BIFI|nr:HAD-IA family hydrolase [Bifidobacterium gallicum]EFA22080.1 putative haloacid dehalogenase, type II [Bifidobacterium gallicum DSM 20093 = LMG 11596]KFI59351.1 heat shock protein, Hsp20 family [Bifidobacterium gallicum DSM 20093 = LMG 11596]
MAATQRYKVIAFDLYGTLVDNITDESLESAWDALRFELDRDGALYHNNDELRGQFGACFMPDREHMDMDPDFEPDLMDAYRGLLSVLWFDADDDTVQRCAWAFRKAATKHLKLFPGAVELLRRLRKEGYRVVLLSNAQTCYTVPEMKELGLLGEFDAITISSEEGLRKPAKGLFDTVTERNQVSPDEVLMVGNNVHCDIDGARHAGFDTVYLHTDNDPDAGRAQDAATLALEGADYGAVLEYILKHDAVRAPQPVA